MICVNASVVFAVVIVVTRALNHELVATQRLQEKAIALALCGIYSPRTKR